VREKNGLWKGRERERRNQNAGCTQREFVWDLVSYRVRVNESVSNDIYNIHMDKGNILY
jgi:hypothetical protein